MTNTVWLASYPKSGNTWFRMFLANYLSDRDRPATLEEIQRTHIASDARFFEVQTGLNPFEMKPEQVDLYRPFLYQREAAMAIEEGTLPLFKKTHDAYTINSRGEPLFPEQISLGAIYFIRNPLDVCASFANHNVQPVERTVQFMLNENAFLAGKRDGQLRQLMGTWSNHVQSWHQQQRIPVHTARYEDMVMQPVQTFTDIARFAGLETDPERVATALEYCRFDVLQQQEQEMGFGEKTQGCNAFFWKGKVGHYREALSSEQVDALVEANKTSMQQFGYLHPDGTPVF